jgi:hypothetical protein
MTAITKALATGAMFAGCSAGDDRRARSARPGVWAAKYAG